MSDSRCQCDSRFTCGHCLARSSARSLADKLNNSIDWWRKAGRSSNPRVGLAVVQEETGEIKFVALTARDCPIEVCRQACLATRKSQVPRDHRVHQIFKDDLPKLKQAGLV